MVGVFSGKVDKVHTAQQSLFVRFQLAHHFLAAGDCVDGVGVVLLEVQAEVDEKRGHAKDDLRGERGLANESCKHNP